MLDTSISRPGILSIWRPRSYQGLSYSQKLRRYGAASCICISAAGPQRHAESAGAPGASARRAAAGCVLWAPRRASAAWAALPPCIGARQAPACRRAPSLALPHPLAPGTHVPTQAALRPWLTAGPPAAAAAAAVGGSGTQPQPHAGSCTPRGPSSAPAASPPSGQQAATVAAGP
jgi:hypothetical protein